LEYPIKIKPSDGALLHAVCAGRHNIEVREGGGLRWMHFGDDAIQAMMILDDPSRPVIPYQLYKLGALLFRPAPDFVLNLGVGGGSFERFFAAFQPQSTVTSVESNGEVIRLLRNYFPVRVSMPVINQEAETYLNTCATSYDLILCDLFDGGNNLQFATSEDFCREVNRCLSSKGVFAINLLPDTEEEMVDILVTVRKSFHHVLMLLVPHFQNTVLFCLKGDIADSDLLEQRASDLLGETGVDLTDVADLVIRLPESQNDR
jgi:spermidine synthase